MRSHHATVNFFTAGHIDTMGSGLEDKVALAGIGGNRREPLYLWPCGQIQILGRPSYGTPA
jgi:hypothetical protein